MTLHFQSMRISTGSDVSDGQLVLADGCLVAVLVQLSDEYDEDAGMWYLEAGFGRTDVIGAPLFADLSAAEDWIERRPAIGQSRA